MHLLLLPLTALLLRLTSAANTPNCGTNGPLPPHLSGHRRVIGGTDARPHEFPWQCSMQFHKDNTTKQLCGATILNDRWLLSAAHCMPFLEKILADIRVVCGVTDLLLQVESTQVYHIKQWISHPNFTIDETRTNIGNDFLLIQLTESLPLANTSAHLGTICLPESQPLDRIEGSTCIATGWGISSRNRTTPPKTVLQKAPFTVVKQAHCRVLWANNTHSKTGSIAIKDWHLCAEGGSRSICTGDSGGFLICWRGGHWYQYGVTSMADKLDFGCSETSKTPNVFARVSLVSQWIWQTIERYS